MRDQEAAFNRPWPPPIVRDNFPAVSHGDLGTGASFSSTLQSSEVAEVRQVLTYDAAVLSTFTTYKRMAGHQMSRIEPQS